MPGYRDVGRGYVVSAHIDAMPVSLVTVGDKAARDGCSEIKMPLVQDCWSCSSWLLVIPCSFVVFACGYALNQRVLQQQKTQNWQRKAV